MRFKVLTLTAMLCLFVLAHGVNAATMINQFGRHPFHKPPLTSVQELRDMIRDNQVAIEDGFAKAGYPQLYGPFMDQYQTADVTEVTYAKGQSYKWMFFKSGKKVKVVQDLVYNGKDTKGYEFTIDVDGVRYLIGVPIVCGNIALLGESAAPAEVVAVNEPPRCKATFTKKGPFCDDIVTVDASGSADPDGSITIASIVVVDGEGNVVQRETMEGPPYVRDLKVPCGKHSIKVMVEDDKGEKMTSVACETEITGLKRNRFIADLAFMHQRDPANFVQARVGLKHRFTERFSVLGLVGAAPKVNGEDGEPAVVADLLGTYAMDRLSVGLGFGGWLTNGDEDIDAEDSQVDLLADVAYRVYGDPEELNTSLFVEARSGLDEMDDAWKYSRYGGGVRVEF